MAKLFNTETTWKPGRRARSGSRRTRLRDGGFASADAARSRGPSSGCCATCASTGSSRDERDPAPLHRARSGRSAYAGRGRASAAGRRNGRKERRGREGGRALRVVVSDEVCRMEPRAAVRRVRPPCEAHGLRRADVTPSGEIDFPRDDALSGASREEGTALARIVDIGTDLFAMAATLSYATSLAKNGQKNAIQLADHFCREARVRIEENFDRPVRQP